MCWSGEASGVLATAGLCTAVYVAWKGESKELWVPLTYFALMELLQAVTYIYIDLCDNPTNQVLTLLGYLHVAFQPFFVNMVGLYFIPPEIKRKIFIPVYTLAGVGSLFILMKGYPFDWAGRCVIGVEGFCGTGVCSVHGDWHIAWKMPLNGLLSYPIHWLNDFDWGLHVLSYILVCFIMPILYGSYRFVIFHYFMGPWISAVTTDDPNEYAAVWCLFSIALCVSVIKSPVRKYLHVKTWPFYSKYVQPEAEPVAVTRQNLF